MRFLILGGSGYLGSKIVKDLLNMGHNVVCTKRPKSDFSKLENLDKHIILIPAVSEAVETAFIYQKFDWVLNMACNYGHSMFLYDDVINSNITFPLLVLNLAAKYRVSNYLTIGTGLPSELNMYSFTKAQFSNFGEFYAKKHEINFINMKLEMFYGSDEPRDRFIPACIVKMFQNKDIDLTVGTQKRDIVSIYDVEKAILCAIGARIKGYYEIFVGTGEAPTIRELLLYIKEETGSISELKFGTIPMRAGEPDCIADITNLTKIGYICRYKWKDGIREMIKEMKLIVSSEDVL